MKKEKLTIEEKNFDEIKTNKFKAKKQPSLVRNLFRMAIITLLLGTCFFLANCNQQQPVTGTVDFI